MRETMARRSRIIILGDRPKGAIQAIQRDNPLALLATFITQVNYQLIEQTSSGAKLLSFFASLLRLSCKFDLVANQKIFIPIPESIQLRTWDNTDSTHLSYPHSVAYGRQLYTTRLGVTRGKSQSIRFDCWCQLGGHWQLSRNRRKEGRSGILAYQIQPELCT